MQKIPLLAVPRQSLSFTVDGAYWQLSVYQSISNMCVDWSRNGTVLIQGVRCFIGQPLLPYSNLMTSVYGNFIFDADVDWNNFENSLCNLYYLTRTEWDAFQKSLQDELTNGNVYAAD